MALYIHGLLRCKNLLGRIPNPHSCHALAAPQHAPGPRSDARSQRTPPGRSCTDQQHHTPPQHRQQNAQHHPHTYDQTARRHPGHTQHTPTQPRSDTQPSTLEAVQHPQPHTIRPPDSTKARPTIKPDRLFLLHDGTGHRPAETIGKNHTARPPPALPAASIFRRGDHPQIRQGEKHQHDHSPAPNKSRPALKADRRPRRE